LNTSTGGVLGLIYDWIMKRQVEKLQDARDPRVVYVTDLVACTHKYHLRKKYPELTLSFEPVAVLGDIAHAGLGKLLAEKGFEVEYEVSREVVVDGESFVLRGRVDAFKRDEGLVVEIKTSRSAVNLPKEHHLKQLKVYLELLGASNGVLIYITPSKIVEYYVKHEPVNIEVEVKNLLVDASHPRYTWECRYCVFRKICPFYQPGKKEEL